MNFYNFPAADIPEIFQPYNADNFTHCIICDKFLLDQKVEYVIEKAVRRYKSFDTQDVIFEYAMCLACAENMKNELSRDSLERIQQFMMHHSKLLEQNQQLLNENNWNINDWIGRCAVTGQPIEEQEEYQLYAHCRGNQIVFSGMPYMIGGTAMDQITGLLSQKTLDELNRFVDDNFGIPPELKQPIKDNPIVLL